jgi:hypothetical protein
VNRFKIMPESFAAASGEKLRPAGEMDFCLEEHGANREIGGPGFAMSWRVRAWRVINN